MVVAASGDLRLANGRPVVFCEHGAGQSYSSRHSSYAGGRGRKGVRLFLCPGAHPSERNRKFYPHVPVVEIGCPKMDRWHVKPVNPEPRTVAISFHWNCTVHRETRSAWGEFISALPELAAAGDLNVIGHAHPRIARILKPYYERAGIEYARSFNEVLRRASCYVCDNSSTIFEFASTDRPVVLMNSRYYRRGVTHGLRFWSEASIGLQVDSPRALLGTIRNALKDLPYMADRRRAAVSRVYTYTDGLAAQRAAAAITDLLSQMGFAHSA